jgi:hypothetical protein
MSVMKTFTVRDLNRSSAKVLATADRDGLAVVRGRNGRAYEVRPRAQADKKPDWAAFAARRRQRLKELFPEGPIMSREQAKEFDQLLADDGRLF